MSAGIGHDHDGASGDSDGSGVRHVAALRERRFLREHRCGILERGRVGACQHAFVAHERAGNQQSSVGGNDVAGFKIDNVAGNKLLRGDFPDNAVSPDADVCQSAALDIHDRAVGGKLSCRAHNIENEG